MSTPIRNAVEQFLGEDRAPFHMPGHKGRAEQTLGVRYDITEVDGADSLFHAQGAILECEQRYAKIYGSGASFISAGGSTLCIQTMLGLVAHRGTKIIAGRMIHSSAVGAMALLGLEPIWIYTPTAVSPRQGIEGLSLPVSSEDVRHELDKCPDAGAVYITSPDYFGQIADIGAIAQVCKKYKVPLLVDNAHGAHLVFSGNHPMQLGADLCCDSLHKSLPVLTGGALLHTAHGNWARSVKETMVLFGSTSPSYLILLSIDSALTEMENSYGKGVQQVGQRMARLRTLAQQQGFESIGVGNEPMRLTVGFGKTGWQDDDFGEYIRSKGIEPEYLGGGVCIFMATPYTTESDYQRLEAAIKDFRIKPEAKACNPIKQLVLPRMCSLRTAVLAPHNMLETKASAGHTCGVVVSTCPPGIPLLVPGELITPAAAEMLSLAGIDAVTVMAQG